MTYKIDFLKSALKEWKALAPPIKDQFKKKLAERLENPHVASARLCGPRTNRYKIKLKSLGYRLVYQVEDQEIVVIVVAIGKREGNEAYKLAEKR
ncbi:type II toxin-antitoxin system RelE family toxin [Rahnella laticis]|uniref:type II toxin-antitoxin system RelE family toxin n=1 Tax=Rahnella laticis TaxID=2787622 RepID=UPI0018A27511|nr:type II toxin-antitoxin system RelE/ParE family toxin [Rahnella laticis]MBF7997041.1 type II toxin-antitoxin system RelE/ParE family toxin [Rahnella laticis]